MESVADRLQKQYGCPVWVGADGTLTPLVLMPERYLRNCLAHVRYRLRTECTSIFSQVPGVEMAQELYYDADEEEDEAHKLRIHLRRWESRLMDEMTRRNS